MKTKTRDLFKETAEKMRKERLAKEKRQEEEKQEALIREEKRIARRKRALEKLRDQAQKDMLELVSGHNQETTFPKFISKLLEKSRDSKNSPELVADTSKKARQETKKMMEGLGEKDDIKWTSRKTVDHYERVVLLMEPSPDDHHALALSCPCSNPFFDSTPPDLSKLMVRVVRYESDPGTASVDIDYITYSEDRRIDQVMRKIATPHLFFRLLCKRFGDEIE